MSLGSVEFFLGIQHAKNYVLHPPQPTRPETPVDGNIEGS